MSKLSKPVLNKRLLDAYVAVDTALDSNLKSVQRLIDAGADPFSQPPVGKSLFEQVIEKGDVHCLEIILTHTTQFEPSLILSEENYSSIFLKDNAECLQIFLNHVLSPDWVDKNQYSLLMHAASTRSVACTKVLLEYGAQQGLETALTLVNDAGGGVNQELIIDLLTRSAALRSDFLNAKHQTMTLRQLSLNYVKDTLLQRQTRLNNYGLFSDKAKETHRVSHTHLSSHPTGSAVADSSRHVSP